MVRHLLTTCGPVVSWKRVQGATGKLQAFGFCEYSNPDAGQRSIRLMNGQNIADKALVVKVDAKTKKILDDYIIERSKKNGDEKAPEGDAIEKYLDEDLMFEDNLAKERIGQILADHSKEIESYVPKEAPGLPVAREAPPAKTLLERMGTRDEGLDDVEEEKKGIIHREIDKFRETMKVREAEKEEQGKKKETADSKEKKPESKEKDKEKDSKRRSTSRSRETRSRERESRSRTERSDRSSSTRERPRRSRSREREPQRRSLVSRSRSRSPPSRRERERVSRERDTRTPREIQRDREIEEEEKENKRIERKAIEKEAAYQERLRLWEARENKKGKEYTKETIKEKKKVEEAEREGRKLKEFLEDYDDERDDPKFYKGREIQRRLADREREAAKDAEDRKRELDEISELKSQIFSDPKLSDPGAEFQRRLQEREQQFLPDSVRIPGANRKAAQQQQQANQQHQHQVQVQTSKATIQSPITLDASPSPEHQDAAPSPMEDYSADLGPPECPSPEPEPIPAPQPQLKAKVEPPKRKKLPVADIFNMEEEDDDKPKKKLRPLPAPTAPTKTEEKKEKSADDKRKHIKSLIEKIPTDKGALFAYSVDWDLVDNQLMEKRIRPWVHKKIAEYIGEPEPTLTDFICSKVLAGSEPKAILEDVQMVLDEEAEVFVVKMWRLLIYEIENKKQKGAGTVPPAK